MCGMSEDEFWESTPRFLSARLRALESSQQVAWEQARFIAFFGHRASGKTLTQFYRFSWEKQAAVFPEVTREEWDRVNDEMDEVLKHVNPGLYAQYLEGKLARQNGEGISDQAKN